jgi:hypothetical protein
LPELVFGEQPVGVEVGFGFGALAGGALEVEAGCLQPG